MYYAGLRPEEAVSLSADCVSLPPPAQNDDWGELHLRTATPDTGREWTDDGSPRERRQLKHRADGDIRIIPIHPKLARLLRDHLAQFATSPDGRLFSGVRGGELATLHLPARLDQCPPGCPERRRASLTARPAALRPTARVPVHLAERGVYPTQVAEWAAHGVDVLLRIYARCVVGQDELTKRRISEALRQA
jgi:integrase